MSYRNLSLRSKILFAAVAPFVIAVVLATPIFATSVIKNIETKAKSYVDEMSYSSSLELKSRLDYYTAEVSILAGVIEALAEAKVTNIEQINDLFNDKMAEHSYIQNAWVQIDQNSLATWYKWSKTENGATYSNIDPTSLAGLVREYLEKASVGDAESITLGRLANQNYIVSSAYHLSGKPHVIGLEINPKEILELLSDNLKYGFIYSSILDEQGKTLTESDINSPYHKISLDALNSYIEEAKKSGIYSQDKFDEASQLEVYEVLVPLKLMHSNTNWYVRLIYPVKSIKYEIYDNLMFLGFVLVIGLVIGISVSTVTARNITLPLSQVSAALHRISGGNYNVVIPKISTNDEVGQMVEAARVFREHSRQLHNAKQLAEEANKAKTDFLANMSHELRTPMHAMLSYAKLGLEKIDDQSSKIFKYFTNIHNSGERLLNLLNDLLDLSKLEAGKVDFAFENTDLNASIDLVLVELKSLISNKKLHVTFNRLTPNINVYFDKSRLSQVLVNLLSNAIKFTPEEGAVIITITRTSDESVQIMVEDDGIGIPEDELDLIFDKFAQSSKTNKGAGGTGLGLSIARGIVHAHNGRIWAENRLVGGAAFKIVLPIKKQETEVQDDPKD